ncbi:MAG: hypothetical protein LBT18_02885 [Endomicrobium sp.]|jgi:hypothetical protein|nr:hypothetical protein [Endomicrobium sp.]
MKKSLSFKNVKVSVMCVVLSLVLMSSGVEASVGGKMAGAGIGAVVGAGGAMAAAAAAKAALVAGGAVVGAATAITLPIVIVGGGIGAAVGLGLTFFGSWDGRTDAEGKLQEMIQKAKEDGCPPCNCKNCNDDDGNPPALGTTSVNGSVWDN